MTGTEEGPRLCLALAVPSGGADVPPAAPDELDLYEAISSSDKMEDSRLFLVPPRPVSMKNGSLSSTMTRLPVLSLKLAIILNDDAEGKLCQLLLHTCCIMRRHMQFDDGKSMNAVTFDFSKTHLCAECTSMRSALN